MKSLYEDREWLYQKHWIEKLSTHEIARHASCSRGTVCYWCRKLNISRRPRLEALAIAKSKKPKYLYQNRDWLYQKYWKENLSQKKIADLLGLPHSNRIQYYMKKFNIQLRPRSEINLGSKRSEEFKKKQSERMKNNKRGLGHVVSEEHRKILSEYRKGKKSFESEESIKKRSKDMKIKMKKLWQNPEYIKKTLKAINRRPTNPEKIFDELTPDIIRYTGNKSWWRKLSDGRYHNPDFKMAGQNKVIEVFGDYWHRGENPQELIDLYAQAGLKCLVFWEREIYNQPELILDKVNNFIEA